MCVYICVDDELSCLHIPTSHFVFLFIHPHYFLIVSVYIHPHIMHHDVWKFFFVSEWKEMRIKIKIYKKLSVEAVAIPCSLNVSLQQLRDMNAIMDMKSIKGSAYLRSISAHNLWWYFLLLPCSVHVDVYNVCWMNKCSSDLCSIKFFLL